MKKLLPMIVLFCNKTFRLEPIVMGSKQVHLNSRRIFLLQIKYSECGKLRLLTFDPLSTSFENIDTGQF